MATKTYYFDGYDVGECWGNNPAYMVDGDTTTSAGSTTVNDSQALTTNTCNGSKFGTITKVELRAAAGALGTGTITLRPVFASGDGDNHNITVTLPTAWSAWQDITTDTNAPSPWDWDDINDGATSYLLCDVVAAEAYDYCAKVEIRVTYTPKNRLMKILLWG